MLIEHKPALRSLPKESGGRVFPNKILLIALAF